MRSREGEKKNEATGRANVRCSEPDKRSDRMMGADGSGAARLNARGRSGGWCEHSVACRREKKGWREQRERREAIIGERADC